MFSSIVCSGTGDGCGSMFDVELSVVSMTGVGVVSVTTVDDADSGFGVTTGNTSIGVVVAAVSIVVVEVVSVMVDTTVSVVVVLVTVTGVVTVGTYVAADTLLLNSNSFNLSSVTHVVPIHSSFVSTLLKIATVAETMSFTLRLSSLTAFTSVASIGRSWRVRLPCLSTETASGIAVWTF